MGKFANKRTPLGETKKFCGVRLDSETIEAIADRHDNQSEWIRDAIFVKLALEDGCQFSPGNVINKDELITRQALKIAELENELKSGKWEGGPR